MATPTLFATGLLGTAADFRLCKEDRSGAVRTVYFSVPVPVGTVAGTVIGLYPFQSGAKFCYDASTIFTDNLGAGTANVGYVYADNVNYTDGPATIATGQTLAAAGPFAQWNVRTAMAWKAGFNPAGNGTTLDTGVIANGYIAITTATATTTTAGVIDGQISLFYDQP